MRSELTQLTAEARRLADYTACHHYVVVIKEPSKCGTFTVYDYDIMETVSGDDHKKHQKIHGLDDESIMKGVRNFVKTR